MSIFHNSALLGAADSGGGGTPTPAYPITRSLRFHRADSASLSRTPLAAGNRTTWTWAAWVKRSTLGESGQTLFTGGTNATNSTRLAFDTSNRLVFENEVSGATTQFRVTTAVFRDTTAWMHVCLAVDTTAANATDRVRLYVNNVQISTFTTNNTPTQNLQLQVNATTTHYIGQSFTPAYANFYLADIYFIDGFSLPSSNFLELDATTGQLIPKAYSGSFGSQGFRLNFDDNSAATASALGKDISGNGRNWTPNNMAVSGVNNDCLVDTPTGYGTDTGLGGEVRGNYCTLNGSITDSTTYLSDGNLRSSTTESGFRFGIFPMPYGKWYWEVTVASLGSVSRVGIILNGSQSQDVQYYGYASNGSTVTPWYNSQTATYSTFTTNDVIGVAYNSVARTVTFYKNGVQQAPVLTNTDINTFWPFIQSDGVSGLVVNFGQRPFSYPAPAEHLCLCSTNLAEPDVPDATKHVDTLLYTGNGSTQSITGLAFQPSMVWIRSRAASYNSAIYDVARGATIDMAFNATAAETTQAGGVTAFNSNGFSVGNLAKVNATSVAFAAWCWKAGGTETSYGPVGSAATNQSNNYTGISYARPNLSAGISVVTYTGTGANLQLGHGLGRAPSFMIVKRRNGVGDWAIYFTGGTQARFLNNTNGAVNDGSYWQNQDATSTHFFLGTNANVNASGQTYVAYLFCAVRGFSAFGGYGGNGAYGNTDGTILNLGFRPVFILVRADGSVAGNNFGSNWHIFDARRAGYNVDNNSVIANTTTAESTLDYIDILANGFKLRSNDTQTDQINSRNGQLYAAWGTSYKYSRAG